MVSASMNVVLLGGAGILGPPIIKSLLAAGIFKVSVLSRPSSISSFPSEVNKLTTDFTTSSLRESFSGQDVIIDLIAQMPLDGRKILIDAAADAGVKRFILSEFSINMDSEKCIARFHFFSQRAAIRQYIKDIAVAHPNFSWTALATGPFYDWGIESNFIGFNLQTCTATIYDDGNQPFSTTTLSTVGQAVASILSNLSETKNKSIYIASFTTTQNEILCALEEATRKKWAVEKILSQNTELWMARAVARAQLELSSDAPYELPRN